MAVVKNEHFHSQDQTAVWNLTSVSNYVAGKPIIAILRNYQFNGPGSGLTLAVSGDTLTPGPFAGMDANAQRRGVRVFYIGSSTGGSNTIVLTGAGASGTSDFALTLDVLQLDDTFVGIDVSNSVNTPALAVTPLTTTTTTANSFVIAGCCGNAGGGNTTVSAPGAPYTNISLSNSEEAPGSCDYKYVTSAGVQTVTYTTTVDLLVGVIATFKITPAASGTAYTIPADQGVYTITGAAAFIDVSMNAIQGTYTNSGQAVGFILAHGAMPANQGTYTQTGQNVNLIWSGAPVAPGGGNNKKIAMAMKIGL